MRVFKNPWFARFAAKEGIADGELRAIVNDTLEAGQAEANLGGGVYKVRLARPGEGKSSGYRVIVYFRSGERTFYVYGFAKASMDNIDQKELRKFKENSRRMQALTEPGRGIAKRRYFVRDLSRRHGMEKKYQSEILMVCHQDAEALHRIGAITDGEAEYDRDCLVPPPQTRAKSP